MNQATTAPLRKTREKVAVKEGPALGSALRIGCSLVSGSREY